MACLRATTDALRAARAALCAVHAVLQGPGTAEDPAASLAKLQSLLAGGEIVLNGKEAGTELAGGSTIAGIAAAASEGSSSGSLDTAVSGVSRITLQVPRWLQQAGQLETAVQQKLGEWEGLVQSHQSPHRVLRWAGA